MLWEVVTRCSVQIIENYDESTDDIEQYTEVFMVGDKVEFDIVDHPNRIVNGKLVPDETRINIQFGDGSVAFGLKQEWFKLIAKGNEIKNT